MVSYFVQKHYHCEAAATFAKAREKLELFAYDVVLLNTMLPNGNGIDLLKLLRQDKLENSGLLIPARNALVFKIKGLNAGANDCTPGRFHCPGCTPAASQPGDLKESRPT